MFLGEKITKSREGNGVNLTSELRRLLGKVRNLPIFINATTILKRGLGKKITPKDLLKRIAGMGEGVRDFLEKTRAKVSEAQTRLVRDSEPVISILDQRGRKVILPSIILPVATTTGDRALGRRFSR